MDLITILILVAAAVVVFLLATLVTINNKKDVLQVKVNELTDVNQALRNNSDRVVKLLSEEGEKLDERNLHIIRIEASLKESQKTVKDLEDKISELKSIPEEPITNKGVDNDIDKGDIPAQGTKPATKKKRYPRKS